MVEENHTLASELILFQTEDQHTRIQVRLQDGSVWLNHRQIGDLFQVGVPTVNEHLSNAYAEGELEPERTIRKLRIVQTEGGREVRRQVDHYNLDAILAVGYRVRSQRGAQFRQWATERLKDYLVKGFAMDDAKLKEAGGGDYFDELLARIRDIRSSEKVFYRKVLEIYATSQDYDPRAEASQAFFTTMQNKMHWAAHGHTAAELVFLRADASQPNMGLTSLKGARPTRQDIGTAKNYLSEDELNALNRIVAAYLDFAELQALNRREMTMAGWIAKLDDFLRLSERDILTGAGRISHERAQLKAQAELARYRQHTIDVPSPVEAAFIESVTRLEQLAKQPSPGGKGKKGKR